MNYFSPANDESVVETVTWRDSSGPLVISEIEDMGTRCIRLRMGEQVSVDVYNRLIIAHSSPEVPKATLDHFVADQVLPRVLAQDGAFILHAGAIKIREGAIIVMGESGQGKSTLVTSFNQAGFALLGDDAMIISLRQGSPHAQAVYPSLRLLPDSIDALLSESVKTTPVTHYSSKHRVDMPIANIEPTSLPIKAIFSIASPAKGVQIELRRLTVANACMAFVESSFALDPSDVSRARTRLEQASALARQVPVFEISYPRDYARLPEVRQAILDQVAALAPA